MKKPATGCWDVRDVIRLNRGQPIIDRSHFEAAGVGREGDNVNGPSLLRIPEWIPAKRRAHPEAAYYLYFGCHWGRYLRLAWARALEGPWTLHRTGRDVPAGGRGVLDLGDGDGLAIGNGLELHWHVASPDALVDETRRRIVLYFHAPVRHVGADLGQKSFVATSPDGLSFQDAVEPVILGNFYFRVFRHRETLWALSNKGPLYRAPDAGAPWTPPAGFDFRRELWFHRGENPLQDELDAAGLSHLEPRHSAVHLRGDEAWLFYSRVGDAPERLWLSGFTLAGDPAGKGVPAKWSLSTPARELLRAAPGWEGGEIEPAPSGDGPAPRDVNQLRDPYLFADCGGELYLLYAGGGEAAIGLARLVVG